MIVPVRFEGREGALAIDTGSALTFLYTGKGSAKYTPRAGTVTIGSQTFDLPGRNFEAGDETGAHIVGVLGAEFLLDATTEFDPVALTITRFEAGAAPDTRGWAAVSLEDVGGHIILTLTIDGRLRRLMWDTGSPHVLLIGEGARPGDAESLAEDAEGTRFPIYAGPSELRIPGHPARTITALRAPSFPYFEGTVRALGGNIDGLAGQSVFGRRRLVFNRSSHTLYVAPPGAQGTVGKPQGVGRNRLDFAPNTRSDYSSPAASADLQQVGTPPTPGQGVDAVVGGDGRLPFRVRGPTRTPVDSRG